MAPGTTGDDALLRGVNYASGGGGILNQTGSIFVSNSTQNFSIKSMCSICIAKSLFPPYSCSRVI